MAEKINFSPYSKLYLRNQRSNNVTSLKGKNWFLYVEGISHLSVLTIVHFCFQDLLTYVKAGWKKKTKFHNKKTQVYVFLQFQKEQNKLFLQNSLNKYGLFIPVCVTSSLNEFDQDFLNIDKEDSFVGPNFSHLVSQSNFLNAIKHIWCLNRPHLFQRIVSIPKNWTLAESQHLFSLNQSLPNFQTNTMSDNEHQTLSSSPVGKIERVQVSEDDFDNFILSCIQEAQKNGQEFILDTYNDDSAAAENKDVPSDADATFESASENHKKDAPPEKPGFVYAAFLTRPSN